MAGHVSVPLYPNLTADSVKQILEHSEARVVFVGKLDEWEGMRAGVPAQLPRVALPLAPGDPDLLPWQSVLEQHAPLEGTPSPEPEQLATIIYTSGTTGMPKGVMLTFQSMYFSANNCLRLFNISDQDRLLSYLPLCHVAERQFVEIASLLAGETIFFADTLETFQQDMQRARPTVFFGVPRIWVKFHLGVISKINPRLLDLLLKIPLVGPAMSRKVLGGLGLDQIRYAVCGAAPVADSTMAWYQSLGTEHSRSLRHDRKLRLFTPRPAKTLQEGLDRPAQPGRRMSPVGRGRAAGPQCGHHARLLQGAGKDRRNHYA